MDRRRKPAIGWSSRISPARSPSSPAHGPDAFYKGSIADLIAREMSASGGLITKGDLAAYAARERAPITGTYHGYHIASMGPPSSGGIALVELLNILEALSACRLRPERQPHHAPHGRGRAPRLRGSRRMAGGSGLREGSHQRPHREALCRPASRGDLDRNTRRPAATCSAGAAGGVRVRPRRRTTRSSTRTATPSPRRPRSTAGYGNGQVVAGAGFLLNNEMDDFSVEARRAEHVRPDRRRGQRHRARASACSAR